MAEKGKYEESDFDASDSRRSFIKKLGAVGAGIAGAGALSAVEGCKPTSEKIRIESVPLIYNVEEGDTPWTVYKKIRLG